MYNYKIFLQNNTGIFFINQFYLDPFGEGNMKFRNIMVSLLAFSMLSGILMVPAFATSFPNLPSTSVTLQQNNLTPYDYPFQSKLSNVPVGFDISNGIYTGWCCDLIGHAIRGSTYQVYLYSSLSLSLPAPFGSFSWDMINYVLNHKQGTGVDVSQAIWYFVNGNNWPTSAQLSGYPFPLPPSTLAQAMVIDALAHGSGYTPRSGGVVAVICSPADEAVQDTIIELAVGQVATRTIGFWQTHTDFTKYIFDNKLSSSIQIDSTSSHAKTINDYGKLFGAFYAGISKSTDGTKRSTIDQDRIILLQQLVAAILNQAASGIRVSTDPVTGKDLITAANLAYSGNNGAEILRINSLLDSFNSGGDSIAFHAGLPSQGRATPKLSTAIANNAFWDSPL
jgi:hypothetical protein